MDHPRGEAPTPAFDEVFAQHPYVTPRMAYRLWAGAIVCSDVWRTAGSSLDILIDSLPPIARPFATGAWVQRFIGCFESIAERVGRGEIAEVELTTCTGEEMALHLVIDQAEADFEIGVDPFDEEARLLPDRGDADHDFDAMRDLLLRDDDVLLLFDPSLDGIDDPDSVIAQIERTVNLHPQRWFLPFDDPDA